jgi:hypothetical protein
MLLALRPIEALDLLVNYMIPFDFFFSKGRDYTYVFLISFTGLTIEL